MSRGSNDAEEVDKGVFEQGAEKPSQRIGECFGKERARLYVKPQCKWKSHYTENKKISDFKNHASIIGL
jgi:hypothetical protein